MSERDELVAHLRRTPGWPRLGNAAADRIDHDVREIERLTAENERLREVLAWYGEQARLARLIHREGDDARIALSADGGGRACAALNKETNQ